VKSTVICHFYNESYLLPFWLNHHKHLFDDGILINYNSTDNSVDLIKSIVPHWQVINSNNECFEALNVDREVMEVERKISGIKICLNVTEFLICRNLKCFFTETSPKVFAIERFTMVQKWDIFIKFSNPVWQTRFYGYKGNNGINGLYRYLHNQSDGNYSLGRHSTLHESSILNEAVILWYGFSPFNRNMIKRKLQIKSQIPKSDITKGYGNQHNVNFRTLMMFYLLQLRKSKVLNLKKTIAEYLV
jgi:hypothetical protein